MNPNQHPFVRLSLPAARQLDSIETGVLVQGDARAGLALLPAEYAQTVVSSPHTGHCAIMPRRSSLVGTTTSTPTWQRWDARSTRSAGF